MSARSALLCAAASLLALALSACGDANGGAETQSAGSSAHRSAELGDLTPAELEASVEEQTAGFLERDGSTLHMSLRRFIGPKLSTKVERGSAVCRPGSETASISDSRKFPFACIVSASADGQGLQVGITLGFVGTHIDGRCWHAANERVSVTTTAPALLSRREAKRAVNQIAGCA